MKYECGREHLIGSRVQNFQEPKLNSAVAVRSEYGRICSICISKSKKQRTIQYSKKSGHLSFLYLYAFVCDLQPFITILTFSYPT